MLQIIVPGCEYFDPKENRFYSIKEQKLVLEHSLVSISKWEAKWKKSYFSSKDKTRKEVRDYIRCMTITQNVDPLVYKNLTAENIESVIKYIEDPMTATTIRKDTRKLKTRKVITSEEIYCEMIQLGIPFECQKWHFNRLNMLMRVCSAKQQTSSKGRKSTLNDLKSRSELNDLRRAAHNSKG